jgi:hypothetical protein
MLLSKNIKVRIADKTLTPPGFTLGMMYRTTALMEHEGTVSLVLADDRGVLRTMSTYSFQVIKNKKEAK